MRIYKLTNIPLQSTSHDSKVVKQTLIANGEIPQLTNLSQATFQPGDKVETHAHKTMFEVFYILKGELIFKFTEQEILVAAGECIKITPGEEHAVENNSQSPAEVLYFGIATD